MFWQVLSLLMYFCHVLCTFLCGWTILHRYSNKRENTSHIPSNLTNFFIGTKTLRKEKRRKKTPSDYLPSNRRIHIYTPLSKHTMWLVLPLLLQNTHTHTHTHTQRDSYCHCSYKTHTHTHTHTHTQHTHTMWLVLPLLLQNTHTHTHKHTHTNTRYTPHTLTHNTHTTYSISSPSGPLRLTGLVVSAPREKNPSGNHVNPRTRRFRDTPTIMRMVRMMMVPHAATTHTSVMLVVGAVGGPSGSGSAEGKNENKKQIQEKNKNKNDF